MELPLQSLHWCFCLACLQLHLPFFIHTLPGILGFGSPVLCATLAFLTLTGVIVSVTITTSAAVALAHGVRMRLVLSVVGSIVEITMYQTVVCLRAVEVMCSRGWML